ncbi:YjjW family glycine radical enzyme activase [Oricola sp.]|uniref:YjjW family glycine radical enzyme activase n=1 Tax=Oricola sp. TaxID=1979950 RepID=UPI003BA954FA
MNTPRATISKILTFSCVDGPGNRLVLFMQGCNFACLACHNPHTMGVCDHCGKCVPVCHKHALSVVDGRVVFDPSQCDQCDECLRACPINANPMVREYDVAEVLAIARDNLPFIDGITVSGGEATMQLKFVTALFEAVKANPELSRLSCMIDSNGYLGPKSWEKVLPVTDGVMLDVKAMNPATHCFLTTADNARVLASARLLQEAGKLTEVRFLVIPGYTDKPDEIAAFKAFLDELGGDVRVRVNAFQHHGVIGPALDWPKATREIVDAVAGEIRAAGVGEVATPEVYV